MDSNKVKQVFEALVKMYIQRPGIEELMKMLEESDFYTAPASTLPPMEISWFWQKGHRRLQP